jgi:hypothetical protein
LSAVFTVAGVEFRLGLTRLAPNRDRVHCHCIAFVPESNAFAVATIVGLNRRMRPACILLWLAGGGTTQCNVVRLVRRTFARLLPSSARNSAIEFNLLESPLFLAAQLSTTTINFLSASCEVSTRPEVRLLVEMGWEASPAGSTPAELWRPALSPRLEGAISHNNAGHTLGGTTGDCVPGLAPEIFKLFRTLRICRVVAYYVGRKIGRRMPPPEMHTYGWFTVRLN